MHRVPVRERGRDVSRPVVSVLTPSIPERGSFLEECQLSVEAQTFDNYEHLVELDDNYRGCAVTMNRLAAQASGEWLLPLADDDLLLPGSLGALVANSADADIVYSPPLVTGNEDRWWFFQTPPVIPSCALVRASLWERLGGYDEALSREEDRALWVRALAEGGRFVRVDEPTWVYRQHAGNKSFRVAA
jgi:glycosyltransferase involved in cell wall biosynthesis